MCNNVVRLKPCCDTMINYSMATFNNAYVPSFVLPSIRLVDLYSRTALKAMTDLKDYIILSFNHGLNIISVMMPMNNGGWKACCLPSTVCCSSSIMSPFTYTRSLQITIILVTVFERIISQELMSMHTRFMLQHPRPILPGP